MPQRAAFIGTATSSPTEAYYATLFHSHYAAFLIMPRRHEFA
jgi:hypothetical protein